MSKPESTGAKSLEEILASIRKSLAEEPTERPTEPRLPVQKAAQPQPKPAAPAANKPASAPAKPGSAPAQGAQGAMPLAAKLAGAVNGSASGHSLDSDLSELLASEPKKPTLSSLGDIGKPADSSPGDAKDPLWFLTRLSAAAAGSPAQGQEGSAARARDAAKAPTSAPAPKVEEVKLSRPETLRPSLPPLFDAVTEPTPPAPKSEKPGGFASATARTQPRVAPPQADAPVAGKEAAKEKAKAEPELRGASASSNAMASAFAAPARGAEPVKTRETAAQAKLASHDPAPPISAETKPPTSQLADPKSDRATESVPTPAGAAEGTPSGPMGGLQSRALEQMVAELLEPVIRQWLQSNLPRLIDKAVREEVARVVAAERGTAKA